MELSKKQTLEVMLFFVVIITDLFITVIAWQCVSPIREFYSRENTNAVLQFSADLTNLNSPRQFEVKFYDGIPKARVTYHEDGSSIGETLPGYNITGDSAGNVKVTLNDVKQTNAGVYILTSAGFSTKCVCLYLLGIPTKPKITTNETPSEGESVTLTCSSASTTTPSNHSLSVIYSWSVNNFDNPGDTKYAYSSNRNKLTVNNVTKGDASKQFTCSAKEDVTDGYTSVSSDNFSFDVYYGPDSARLNVTSPIYLTEGDTLAIACTADCYPVCSCLWTNVTSGLVINGGDALLNINSVDKYMIGDYKCTCNNTAGSYRKSTDIIVNITIKERTLVKWFYIGNNVSQTTVTVDEKDVDVTFTCNISGDPATHVRVMLEGKTLKEEAQTNSLVYVLERVTCFDTGVYQCESRSGEMEVSRRYMSLFVKCSPRPLRKTRENITSPLDVPITLTFEVLAYPDPGQRGFTWHKERGTEWLQILSNEDLDIVSSDLVSNLTIFSVSESDFGQYRVTAVNNVGSYHQYFHLSQQDPNHLKGEIEECTSDNTLVIGIVLGIICVIVTTYAAAITIIWKRNVSATKHRCTSCKGKDKGKESTIQTSYVNVANTSIEEQARERLPQNIGREAAYEDVSDRTQYTELDTLSREKIVNMYDMIKRE